MTLVRHLAVAVVLGALLVIISITISPFRDYQMAEVACYVVAVAGLTTLGGLSGQISLGNGAFMAIGAYAAALLLLHLHWPLAVVLVASAAAAAAGGAVVGVAAARLRGPYLAGATLMLAVALPSLALRFGLLGGDQGLTVVITSPGFLGQAFPVTRWQAWLTCGCALIVLVLLANLTRSRVGRSWRAAGDDEVAAALAGLNVAGLRVLAFVVSAACAGLAGGALVVVSQLAAPGAFQLALSLALLTGIVLGGLGSLTGALWGAIALVYLPQWSDDLAHSFSLSNDVQSNLPLALYGIVLMAVIVAAPQGIQGALRGLARIAHARLRKSPSTPTQEGA
jgi:branched-chain amino acid transport system permease protein